MTRLLYYEDSHIRSFDAVVTSCRKAGEDYEVTLSETAFFPEGGGQSADTGMLGGTAVKYTFEREGEVIHRTASPLTVGEEVHGEIDWEKRFRNMQNHTAEHIISGIVHRRHGFSNVGFHMGEEGVIVDFDGFITPEELADIEREANRIVTENHAVMAYFPSQEELGSIDYRSKLDLKENVRLVVIEDVDVCACCAPHVRHTGEIGVIKIFESGRRKGGVRLRMLAGGAAYEDYVRRFQNSMRISALLSAKQEDLAAAVERLLAERDKLSYELGGARREIIAAKVAGLEPRAGNLLFFEPSYGVDELRLLVNSALPRCGGICGAFAGEDGHGYRYVLASRAVNMRAVAKDINTALSGRGGGTPEMITGTLSAARAEIEKYFESEAVT